MLVTASPIRCSGSDRLGRYYTDDSVSQLLVGQMGIAAPGCIVDLGAGDGTLSLAAATRWVDSKILTVDVDSRSRIALADRLKGIRYTHLRASALNLDLPCKIRKQGATLDAGVCNPPFILPKWRNEYIEILRDAGFSSLPRVARDIEAPAIFLAQNMRILGAGSTLGIILPDSLMSAERYRWFREGIVENYRIRRSIKLPRGSFKGTDALAHVLVIEKLSDANREIRVARFEGGEVVDEKVLSVGAAMDRMDIDYHASRERRLLVGGIGRSLELIGAEVHRGSLPNAAAAESGTPVLHTTDIRAESYGKMVDLPASQIDPDLAKRGFVIAEAGDILLARVGRNFATKVVGVRSGRALLTDCVYRIRVAKKFRVKLLSALASKAGEEWLNGQAHGVSATQLPKGALLHFTF